MIIASITGRTMASTCAHSIACPSMGIITQGYWLSNKKGGTWAALDLLKPIISHCPYYIDGQRKRNEKNMGNVPFSLILLLFLFFFKFRSNRRFINNFLRDFFTRFYYLSSDKDQKVYLLSIICISSKKPTN